MQNLTILYSNFKKALESSPHIKVIDSRSQFDPPSDSRKRTGLAELGEEGFDTDAWLGSVICLSKGNSMTYHVIRDRQNRGEGSFNLNNPHEFLVEAEPWVVKNASTEADQQLLKRVRVIDQPNVAQTFTGVVMGAGSPPKIPQELVYFRRGHLLPMSLPFSAYYETLAAFMGIVDWQLLYTDADRSLEGLAICFEQLIDSYEAFKLIFPDRDLSLWGAKLREKGLIA
jgi:hypothetical protein